MVKRSTTFVSVLVLISLLLTMVAVAQNPVQEAGDAYFSGGTQNIKAADLFDNLNDGDTSNDPFIIDARAAADYDLGHIPGAVNIGAKAAFTPDVLATIPTDQDVVVYCYTGQTSSQMTSALNMLGYSAKSMLYGFPTWANVEGVGVAPFDAAVDQHDYKVETEANVATETYELATPLGATVAEAAEAYFINGTKNTKASAVFDNLNDGDDSNNPYIVDVRAAEDYAAGHVPGAVNVSAKAAMSMDTLASLPADMPIVVYCYSGQTASQVTSALNMAGYDASNMKFGFASWSPSGVYKFNAADSPNYKFEGTGSVASADAPAEAPAPAATPEATPAPAAEAPAQLPATGGMALNFTWMLVAFGSGLLGVGAYLRRK